MFEVNELKVSKRFQQVLDHLEEALIQKLRDQHFKILFNYCITGKQIFLHDLYRLHQSYSHPFLQIPRIWLLYDGWFFR